MTPTSGYERCVVKWFNRVKGYVETGVKEGAKLVVDGRGFKVPGFEGGFFTGGTLFDHVTPAMRIYQEEIFGPVLCIVRVGSLEEAIRSFEASRDAAEAGEQKEELAAAHLCLANVELLRGNLDEAAEVFLKARDLSERAGHDRLVAQIDQIVSLITGLLVSSLALTACSTSVTQKPAAAGYTTSTSQLTPA